MTVNGVFLMACVDEEGGGAEFPVVVSFEGIRGYCLSLAGEPRWR